MILPSSLKSQRIYQYINLILFAETFLDSSIFDNYSRLAIDGYNLICCDHPSNSRKGGVCLYFKDNLRLLVRIPDLTNLEECLVCKLRAGSKQLFFTVIYRSPSQTLYRFSVFKRKCEETIVNINNCSPLISLYVGDFNARNLDWWENYIRNTQCIEIADFDKHTHILPNSPSCIDFFFTCEPNFIVDSRVHPSLFPRCHHQLLYAKIKFKMHFPPTYTRRIWDFYHEDTAGIRQAMFGVDWNKSFSYLIVHEKVSFLTDCILNICGKFVPNKLISIRDKNAPLTNPELKRMFLEKAKIYRGYVKKGRKAQDYECLRESISRNAINVAKEEYYTKLVHSLNDPGIGTKKYWSTLHRLLGKRKLPRIPPIQHNNTMIIDSSEKATIFNLFFCQSVHCNTNRQYFV